MRTYKGMKARRLELKASLADVSQIVFLSGAVITRVEEGHKYPERTINRIWAALDKIASGRVTNQIALLMPTYICDVGPLGAIRRKERIYAITHRT